MKDELKNTCDNVKEKENETELTPFGTNWKKGSGATPLTSRDLFFGDAISIPPPLPELSTEKAPRFAPLNTAFIEHFEPNLHDIIVHLSF